MATYDELQKIAIQLTGSTDPKTHMPVKYEPEVQKADSQLDWQLPFTKSVLPAPWFNEMVQAILNAPAKPEPVDYEPYYVEPQYEPYYDEEYIEPPNDESTVTYSPEEVSMQITMGGIPPDWLVDAAPTIEPPQHSITDPGYDFTPPFAVVDEPATAPYDRLMALGKLLAELVPWNAYDERCLLLMEMIQEDRDFAHNTIISEWRLSSDYSTESLFSQALESEPEDAEPKPKRRRFNLETADGA